MEAQRSQIARDLHDEIGGFLTGMAMHASGLKRQDLNPLEREEKIVMLAQLSRSIIDAIRDTLWSIDAQNDKMDAMIARMYDHIATFNRASTEIRFKHTVNRDAKLEAAQRQHLFRIFKEALNNAMKHSDATHIHIVFSHDPQTGFQLIVENDGVHETNAIKDGGGQGLANMKMRAEKINAVLTVTQPPGHFRVLVQSR